MIILGANGELLHCNEAFKNIISSNGFPVDYTAKRIVDFIYEEDKNGFEQQLSMLIDGKISHFQLEVRCPSRDGKIVWLSFEITHALDEEKNKRFLFGIVQDITENKEGQFKLITEKESAEKATRVKSDFLANMSHEIRTPIHTVIGMNELLLDTKLDAEQQEYAHQVKFAADVLLSLINDILDFSKIEAGKLTLEDIEFDLHALVEDSVDLLSLEAHKKGLEAALRIDEGVPKQVIGDPVRLRQIIVNLFNNAIKFTKEGEIVLTMSLKEETEDRYLCFFQVRDTGIGIEKEKLKVLFQAFSQIDTSTTRKFGGTGLGLSISKNLVQMMGGDIGVDSVYQEGSTFAFTVSLGKAGEQKATVSIPEWYNDIHTLVVDDNETSRSIVRDYLHEWGCRTEVVSGGAEALNRLKENALTDDPFNLCIVDLLMPGMDGWQFASEVNADKSINSTKMVLLSPTGKSGDEAKMKLLRWYDDYLSKPLKKNELYESIHRIMRSDFDLEAVEDEEVEEVEILEEIESAPPAKGFILIAEDHEVNQQLFKTILENMGHTVRIANNGIEAVKAVESEDFSLIFMDVQMPEMNGYEATEKIREKGIRTPIIAATASAVKGEQERCFEVGMDDILIKPFKKKDIIPLLEKWMVAKKQGTGTAEPVSDAEELLPVDETYVFNFPEAISNFMGKKEVVIKVLHSFIDKAKHQLPAVLEALQNEDFETVHREAHTIKGGAWNLEIKKLGDKAKVLEDTAREGLLQESLEAFEELQAAYSEFLSVVDQYLTEKPTLR